MSDLTGVEPGKTVLRLRKLGGERERNQVPDETIVTRLTATRIFVLRSKDRPDDGTESYDRTTGRSKDGFSYITTRVQYEEERAQTELTQTLRKKHHVETYGEKSATVLRALLAALDGTQQPMLIPEEMEALFDAARIVQQRPEESLNATERTHLEDAISKLRPVVRTLRAGGQ